MATIPRVVSYEKWLGMPLVQDGVDEVVTRMLKSCAG